ncbi:Pre-mRNA-processing factor 19 [Candida viswanathii]|uniref:Pre-mRNA-processing factor 19 n=1 Tax=Candida viswanathii TaxID=5486 RepID=A0A367XXQ6_9ASCO|nr:Pre-mRNA-processing factor 19 [Candida viswanathii]
MICSISGEPAKEPVVSPKSGAIFDKKHIVNYISTSGTDPVTDEPLSESELIPLKTTESTTPITNVPAPSNTSIPALLSTFQNEWDAVVLEVFTLRKQLQRAREELSVALYKQDAAINVAAKAIRERDEAKEALEQLSLALSVRDEPMEDGEEDVVVGDSEAGLEKIERAKDELFRMHKAQKVKFPFDVDTMVQLGTPTKKEVFEGETVSLYAYNREINTIVGVGRDGVIKQSITDGVISNFETPDAKLVAVSSNGIIAAVSKDSITFSNSPASIDISGKPVRIIPHPSLDVFVVLTSENWMVVDSSSVLARRKQALSLAALHQDGEILAAQVGGEIHLFSIISGDQLGTFNIDHSNITKIEFARNGYWLLVLSGAKSKSTVQVFDLRKATEAHKLEFNEAISNFIIDPTTSVLVTFSKKKYTVSRYVKRTKSWDEGEPQNLDASFNSTYVELVTTANDILDSKPIEVFAADLKKNTLVYSKLSK